MLKLCIFSPTCRYHELLIQLGSSLIISLITELVRKFAAGERYSLSYHASLNDYKILANRERDEYVIRTR